MFIFLDIWHNALYDVWTMKSKLIDVNGKHLTLVDEKKETKRPHLAEMMALPKKYRIGVSPEQRKIFAPVDPADDPTKDQIIQTIGSAYPEMVSFLKDTDELKRMYAEACGVIQAMHRAAVGRKNAPIRGVLEDVEDACTAGRRAMDVLRSIAYNISGDQPKKAQAVAQRFFAEEERLRK